MSLNLTDNSEVCCINVLFILKDDYFTVRMLEIDGGVRI